MGMGGVHFSNRVRDWFDSRFAGPTDIQARAWPVIAEGGHVLLTAPTGSGKTLTAFLWAIDRLATRAWEPGGVRVLYVSPLKALNTDIRRNLLLPLEEMGLPIRVQTRSGDTPPAERRKMLRHPPEILVTTPESLNLLLSSHGGRAILTGVETVILDEIHAVAGDKRGTYLMSAVERLVELSGEFQRISLSATVRPLDTVAALVAGYDDAGEPRPIRILESADEKKFEFSVRALAENGWPPLVEEFKEIVAKNRSTLFFVNNRALSERLVRWINEEEDEPIAYAHHGSLSREIRALVEERLKEGTLKAIVATSSLEMGIDIGTLDEVVLVQSPRSINSAVQRVGRAGHAVGETSFGRLYPTHDRDFLDAAVLAPLVQKRASEELRPVRNPLDVLAQVVTAMCGVRGRTADELLAILRRCWSFHTLSREAFDRVLAMLYGRYAEARIRELRPRLRFDPETGVITARDGVLPIVWRSGGVIPDRGYFSIRVTDSGTRLGELDEEFVWERTIGDHFTIGAQTWRIDGITRNDVLVAPSGGTKVIAPFWRAERFDRDFELCEAIGRFLEHAEARVEDEDFEAELQHDHRMTPPAAQALTALLRKQRVHTGAPLPHRHHLLVEHVRGDMRQVVFHAGWGGRVLRPWAYALTASADFTIEAFASDDSLMVQVPERVSTRELLNLVTPENVEELLRKHLEQTGFFGARFRENAARALLLPRHRANQRMPLWLTRLRAKKLLQSVSRFSDFPIVAETWRTCLEDEFDLARLRSLLDELRTGAIAMTEVHTLTASPLAGEVAFQSTSKYMYEDDRPLADSGASISEQALREVLHDAALRPKLPRTLVEEFEAKLQGRAEGYEMDPVVMVEERLLVPAWEGDLPGPLVRIGEWIAPKAQRTRVERALAGHASARKSCVAEFLQTHGPVTAEYVHRCWSVPESVLVELVEEGRLVADRLTEGATQTEYCDADNLERLLRLARAAARPEFAALPKETLPLWLATWQGVAPRGDSLEDLRARLETLFGFVAPAALWESAYLPARLQPYEPAWIDQLMVESDLIWFGGGHEQTGFCFVDDVPLFLPEKADAPEILPDPHGSYDFFELGRDDTAALAKELWEQAWQGRLHNDTFMALRKGIETKFTPKLPRRRRGLGGWTSSRPLVGRWRALVRPGPGDRLQQAEDDKERARQLLARYGVLFRALCAQELPALRWGRLLKALRILELSGEVLAGQFFAGEDGPDGLQFCSHEAFRRLRQPLDETAVYWLNATDPAALCDERRVASTWLVYHGARLVLVARRGGREVELMDDLEPRYLELFRQLGLAGRLEVETIDGVNATTSPHADAFVAFGFLKDRKALCLERNFA